MQGLFSINGQIQAPDDANLSPLDRGFLFGDNVFEVLVGFKKNILELYPHLTRLRESAGMISLEIPWTNEQLAFEIEALLEVTHFQKTYIRLVVTRGESLGLGISSNLKPNRFIYCFPAAIMEANTYQQGIKLKSQSQAYTNRGAVAKTGNYLSSITALSAANKSGFDDVLWVNSELEVTEASTSNIFLLGREGDFLEIATPPAYSGLLLGITRRRIISILTNSKIKVTERTIYQDEIPKFDEGFLCSTVKGLVPIAAIDSHRLHTMRTNSTYRLILRLFNAWVASEIGYQVNWNTGAKASK